VPTVYIKINHQGRHALLQNHLCNEETGYRIATFFCDVLFSILTLFSKC